MGEESGSLNRHDGSAPDSSVLHGSPGLERILREKAVWAVPPTDLEERIRKQLAAFPPADDDSSALPQRPRRGFLTRGRLTLAASVGLVAAAGGVGLAALQGGGTAHSNLAGTPLAPNARAEVGVRDTSSGVEIRLKVDGLPGAPAGSYYQGWVKGSQGTITIGTFHLRKGSDDVVLWSGVDLRTYPTITVTVQSETAGPASSGRVVLTGQAPAAFR
ncbi:hypothetical protein GCM10029976_042060 [Kribbella albertanoniae]|uniref:Anti-sigma factor n=1 Tax=Kribbella albertanoniae TaxID=1266829 RepID=A0A4R4QEW0_9ACTN|nr:anti-sigma factor [Kribbella albertanoniae]TDC34000.1 anti-sigma factor [Kribbella albertanoniae]